MNKTNSLFSRLSIGTMTLRNRIVVPPMCQYSALDGCANTWHLVHYGQLAASGAGMVIVEATAVSPEGRISPNDLGLYSDETEESFREMIEGIRRAGVADTPLAVQLAHAGRKASSAPPWDGGALIPPHDGGWRTVAPSAIPFRDGEEPPVPLDTNGMSRLRNAFTEAARRAVRAGVDAIEIHAAHGYLLHEFLSPVANERTDEWGGSPENRMRFPLQVIEAVRGAVPTEIPVGIRISAVDWVDGGWDLDGSVAFCRKAEARGCAWIHVSSGGVSPLQSIPAEPGYQVAFAERIRAEIAVPVIAVGLITEPEHAAKIVAEGRADLVALGRAMLYNPRWPWHAAAHLGAAIDAPRQYWRSAPVGQDGLFLGKPG